MEEGLREVSIELMREGHRITLAGLGPSPRARNRRDRTVIDVSAEDGTTKIAVDVTYQASAFLGEASQDSVVRAKLVRVFDEMRNRLGLEHTSAPIGERSETVHFVAKAIDLPAVRFAARRAENTESAAAVAPPSDPRRVAPQPSVQAVLPEVHKDRSVEAAASHTDQNAIEEPVREIEEIAPVKAEETEKTEESATEEVEEINAAPYMEEEKKQPTRPARRFLLPEILSTPMPIGGIEDAEEQPSLSVSTAAASAERLPSFSQLEEDEAKGSKLLKWSAWAAAFVVLVLAPAVWLYLPRNPGNSTEPAPVQTAAPAVVAQPAPVQPPPPPPPGSEEDPAAAVKDWESAMQSNDAAKQAAFYADPVDRYFLRHNLSNADVLADRQTQVASRKDGWMVAMERIKVKQQPDTTATVHLVKHFTIRQDGKLTSEWFVPSQLLLKRADGRWQITSERDMGWAPSMDELDY